MDGVVHLQETIQKVREDINPGLKVLGVVLTMYDRRTLISREVGGEGKRRVQRESLHDRDPGQRQARRGAEPPQVHLRVRLRLNGREGVPRACEGDPELPRRLGDDPLARARDERAKAAQASALVAPDSGGSGGVAQPSSRTSYNDVFYQRRADGSNLVVASRPKSQRPEEPRRPQRYQKSRRSLRFGRSPRRR